LIGSPFVDRGRRRRQAAAGEVIVQHSPWKPTTCCPFPLGRR
jgi:hypothetical protein